MHMQTSNKATEQINCNVAVVFPFFSVKFREIQVCAQRMDIVMQM